MPAATAAAEPDDAARRMVRVHRIAGAGRLQRGERRGDGLAEQQSAGAADARYQHCIGARPVTGIGSASRIVSADRRCRKCPSRRPAGRAGAAPSSFAVPSARPRAVEVERHESPDLGFARRDRLGAQFDDGAGRVVLPSTIWRARSRADSIKAYFQ